MFDIKETGFSTELQYKVFLDRYASKSVSKGNAKPGDIVLHLVDPVKGQREIAKVIAKHDDGTFTLEYLTGEKALEASRRDRKDRVPFESIDLPSEYTTEDLAERVSLALANAAKQAGYPTTWAEDLTIKKGIYGSLAAGVDLPDLPVKLESALYKEIISSLKFIPAGRILSGAGIDYNLTLFNCFVIASPKDSRKGINNTLGLMTEIMARGGGVGINLSSLRYRGAYVKGVNGRSSGAVSWGEEYSRRTGKVEQGGCFGPDERIYTTSGMIPAKQLFDRMGQGEVFYALTHKGPRQITARFANGIKPLYEVTTELGFKTRMTMDHKVGIYRNDELVTVALKELKVGDDVAHLIVENSSDISFPLKKLDNSEYHKTCLDLITPDILTEDLAYFVGYSFGNGYIIKFENGNNKGINLSLNKNYEHIKNKLVHLGQKLFSLEASISDSSVYGDNSYNVNFYSRQLCDWLQLNGLLKSSADSIRVPEAIFQSSSNVIKSFLAGYFDADGCDRGSKGGYGFDSISLPMLEDVQKLLAAIGILSHITYPTPGKKTARPEHWAPIYRLSITGCIEKGKFASLIPADRVDPNNNGKRDQNMYPANIYKALNIPNKYHLGIWDPRTSNISRQALTKIADRVKKDNRLDDYEKIQQILRTPLAAIKTIELVGDSEVYDFEVDGVHMLSTGIFSSNSRRGALILILNDWHPDLMEFINCKRDGTFATNCNISIAWSDAFMKKAIDWVENGVDSDWDLLFPDTTHPTYNDTWAGVLEHWIADGKPVNVARTLKVSEIWEAYTSSNWASAEPGAMFVDRANYWSNSQYYREGYLQCTNPCGEQLLPAGLDEDSGSVCNLGHINLSKFGPSGFYKSEAATFEEQLADVVSRVNWKDLQHTVNVALRFMDTIYDATSPINDSIGKQSFSERRIGFGTLGLAELLIRLGITYGDNPLCLSFLDELYFYIAYWSYQTSVEMAKERGAFPYCDKEKHANLPFVQLLQEKLDTVGLGYDLVSDIRHYGIRNVTLITQAPTGTTGILCGTSTGIEPYPFLSWVRKSRIGQFTDYANVVKDYRSYYGLSDEDPLPEFFVTAADPETAISPRDHSSTQAVIQRWTDSSISKTCNLPENFEVSDVSDFYISLYKLGAKGGTVYRDKSRSEQVLMSVKDSRVASSEYAEVVVEELTDITDMPIMPNIPDKLDTYKDAPLYREATSELGRPSWTTHLETPVGRLFVNISFLDNDPYEVFIFVGKGGSEIYANCEAIGRLCSMFLQVSSHASPGQKLIKLRDHLRNIGGSEQIGFGPKKVRSLPDGVGRALDIFLEQYPEGNLPVDNGIITALPPSVMPPEYEVQRSTIPAKKKTGRIVRDICPNCGSAAMEHSAGCMTCQSCGNSKC